MGQREEGFNAYYANDYDEAFRLLSPFAEAGDVDAQCAVGSMYQLGLGVAADGRAAEQLYLRAGERGSGLAYNNLATMYVTGCAYFEADAERARGYWRKAKESGFDMIPDSWCEAS